MPAADPFRPAGLPGHDPAGYLPPAPVTRIRDASPARTPDTYNDLWFFPATRDARITRAYTDDDTVDTTTGACALRTLHGTAWVHHDGSITATGQPAAAEELRALINEWATAGPPTLTQFTAELLPTETDEPIWMPTEWNVTVNDGEPAAQVTQKELRSLPQRAHWVTQRPSKEGTERMSPRRRPSRLAQRAGDPKAEQRRKADQRRSSEAAQLARPALIEKLRDRCNFYGYRLDNQANSRGDDQPVLHIPNGSESVDVRLDPHTGELRRMAQAVSSGLHWLGRYAAFTEIDRGYIEAAIGSVLPEEDLPSWVAEFAYYIDPDLFPQEPSLSPSKKRLSAIGARSVDGRITAHNDRVGIGVEVSAPSSLADMLKVRMYPSDLNLRHWGSYRKATIKIWRSAGLRDRDHALQVLESVSNSFSFALDARYSVGFRLSPRPSWPPFADDGEVKETNPRGPAQQPLTLNLNRYSETGLRYYWHGRQARSIPSMEYLNYYQILEYHFAQYAMSETVAFARRRLKDPRFDSTNEEELTRFVGTIGKQLNSRKHELPSLRATLNACVDPGLLAEFIEADDELKAHLGKSNTIPGTPQVLPRQLDSLLERTAERIYAIRNQLVHAKAENRDQGTFILVPGSDEIQNLAGDIKLVRFAAQSVLIASSAEATDS